MNARIKTGDRFLTAQKRVEMLLATFVVTRGRRRNNNRRPRFIAADQPIGDPVNDVEIWFF
jgi:hypothetical protein